MSICYDYGAPECQCSWPTGDHWHCTKCGNTEKAHQDDDRNEVRACPFCSGAVKWMTLKEGAAFEQAYALNGGE